MKVYIIDYKNNGTINTTFFMRDGEGFSYAKHFFKQVEEMFGTEAVELHRGILKRDGSLIRKSLVRSCEKSNSNREKKPFLIETVAKDPAEETKEMLRKLEKEVRELKKDSEQVQMQHEKELIWKKEEPKINLKKYPKFDPDTFERIG